MEPENKTNGALIGSVIIVIILIVGGVYLFKKGAVAPTPQTENDTADIMEPEDTSTSTEIEAELNNIDLDSLDSEF